MLKQVRRVIRKGHYLMSLAPATPILLRKSKKSTWNASFIPSLERHKDGSNPGFSHISTCWESVVRLDIHSQRNTAIIQACLDNVLWPSLLPHDIFVSSLLLLSHIISNGARLGRPPYCFLPKLQSSTIPFRIGGYVSHLHWMGCRC